MDNKVPKEMEATFDIIIVFPLTSPHSLVDISKSFSVTTGEGSSFLMYLDTNELRGRGIVIRKIKGENNYPF